ncbi:hypothetical protein M7I_2910 [Glarea lozoyensis 74030]|uniref:Nudix n=1 Tax=Glarea lozoyensis (strain ATCC 74030 / MF5533) TaxID=1104152 RepID=H0EK22_GLAL7|nr:hypothetical protein M7I_2910 [Glarea lozoyensis 74030]
MTTTRSTHFSDQFVISCGTVTLDLAARKVLILLWRKNGEYLLPKGRKDIGEDIQMTALHSTETKTQDTQMEDEDFDTVWVDEGKVLDTLTWEDDRIVVSRAMSYWNDV